MAAVRAVLYLHRNNNNVAIVGLQQKDSVVYSSTMKRCHSSTTWPRALTRGIVLLCLPVAMAFASVPVRMFPITSRPSLSVRGGGDIFSDLAPIFSQVSKVVKTHVEPILKDPNGRILQPLQDFAKQKGEESKQRRAHYQTKPSEAMVGFALLSPLRIVRLTVTALIIAETLDYLGIFEDPKAAKRRVVKVLKQANVPSVQNWWKGARLEGGMLHPKTWTNPSAFKRKVAMWQPKHQFALGAGVGLVFSHSVWSVAEHALKFGVVVYILSEVNQLVMLRSGQSVPQKFGIKVGAKVETGLERVRGAVRRTAREPAHLVESIPNLIDRYVPDGGLPPNTKSGFVSGLVAGVVLV
jgi:hypothetical protein